MVHGGMGLLLLSWNCLAWWPFSKETLLILSEYAGPTAVTGAGSFVFPGSFVFLNNI